MSMHWSLIKAFIGNAGIMITLMYLCGLANKYFLHQSTREMKQYLFVLSCIAAGWISVVLGVQVDSEMILDLSFIPLIIAPMFISTTLPILVIAVGIGLGRLVVGSADVSWVGFFSIVALGLIVIALNHLLRRTSSRMAVRMSAIIVVINTVHFTLTADLIVYPLSMLLSALFVFMIRDLQLEFVRRASLVEEASRDHLTKLYNVRSFERYYQELMNQAGRIRNQISLAFIDIDHFKQVNDTYGHAIGDVVLRKVAEQLSGNLRWNDFVARYGGEEFVVILPDTGPQEAMDIMDRLRISIGEQTVRLQKELVSVTVSVGIATYPQTSSEHLIEAADQALYQAKAQGRNQCLHIEREQVRFVI